jgi:hypothetical protein
MFTKAIIKEFSLVVPADAGIHRICWAAYPDRYFVFTVFFVVPIWNLFDYCILGFGYLQHRKNLFL